MWLLVPAASAYETDQLTGRELPLEDVSEVANRWADELLAEAVLETNRLTRCSHGVNRTQRELAQQIARATARPDYVEGRELKGFGYVEYAARLEEADIPRRTFVDRADIYADLTPADSLVLGVAGVASTIRLGGELIGTDKVDHFFLLGYQYARVSRFGRDPEAAYRWGVITEISLYGQLASNVFSYADLAANAAGYDFYVGLLQQGSLFQLQGGCVVQSRPFDWEDWVTPAWDEVLNPSVPNVDVRRSVERRLVDRREQYCETYRQTSVADAARRVEVIAARDRYVVGPAPASDELMSLDWLCGPGSSALDWAWSEPGLAEWMGEARARLNGWRDRSL